MPVTVSGSRPKPIKPAAQMYHERLMRGEEANRRYYRVLGFITA